MDKLTTQLMDGFTGSFDAFAQELGKRLKTVTKRRWHVMFRDRGMGHGDFAVGFKFKGRDIVVVECPCREIAEHIVANHEAQR